VACGLLQYQGYLKEELMTHNAAISTLNNLIETVKDGEQGFRTAAEGLKDPQVRALFQQFSRQRTEMARELQDAVRKLGGTPETSTSMSGSLHRGWMNIKSAVTGADERMIIAEAERGEDVAKAAFDAALQEPLPADVKIIVQRHAAQVREVHDRVRSLEQSTAR
jgi:uncharacterized protein (TIGR02284 family)